MNNLIAATEIDAWAKLNPRRAQELLPELIVRLILCTSSKINDYNFPIEKGIQFSGYDGVLDSGEATSYFPEGKSVWEFGTNEDALGKFKSDIEKRHTEPLGVDINNTAFIFSTLKIWNHRTSIEEALNESRAKYNWKEIRIIDGAKIALWLQSYTAVAVWFANIIGKPIHGIRAIEDYWTDYCETTLPKLNKDYFLLGRDSQIDQLSKWIEKKSGSLTLISESSIESVLFVAAYFLNYPERDRAVMNKTLIVESPEEWNSLIISDEKDCLLIPVFNFTEDIRCPSELFIILPVAKYSPLSKITKNVDSIIELLRKICRKYPTTGNELITKLLPTGHSTCGCIQKPRWHSFENEFDEGVTRKEHSDTLQAIADIAMSGVATAVQWSNIIKHASFFFRARVSWVDTLMEYCKEIPELERNEIAKSLRSEINRNREFCNADWAIPKEFVDKMEQVLLNLLPAGCEQYEYLFKQNPKLLHPIPYEEGTFDYQKRRSYLRGIRMNVIHQILDKCGADTLIEFSFKAEDTEELAEIIVETILHRTYDFPLICKIKLENHRLYVSVLWRLYQANGLEQFLIALGDAELTNEQIADMLCYGPLEPSVWEKLEEFGEDVARYYWEHISVFRLDEEYNEHWDYFLGQLLKYNRPFSAAHAIVFSGYSNSTMIMNILRKCCELQDYTESTGATFMGLAEHDILNLFEKLHSDQNIELDKLVQLEVSFLPYFRFNSTPKGIIRHLHNNPIEYVNLLTYNYKPDPGSDFTMKEHSDDWGRLAYEIVELFKVVPGCRETPVSEREFKEWVAVAQDYADSIGYSGSFAYCFGRVLSYAPTGDDGIFPHEMVRDYFEHTHCEKLIEGFIAGKQSQRGVHTVTGGMEEKEISIKYREDASKLHISYPHTAAILEKLAECYWQESLYEQKRELLDFRG